MVTSAKKGHLDAQFALGRYLRAHSSLPSFCAALLDENQLKDMYWYLQAAEAGHITAQLELAGMYERMAVQAVEV